MTNFHTYTLDWNTNALLFYVDGHLYESQTNWSSSTASAYPFPFNQPFFIIMNVAIGGNYLGKPTTDTINSGTLFPAGMLVDYVRLYNITAPLRLSVTATHSGLSLAWPSNIVAHLQTQISAPGAGLGNGWLDTSIISNPAVISPTNSGAFFRAVSP